MLRAISDLGAAVTNMVLGEGTPGAPAAQSPKQYVSFILLPQENSRRTVPYFPIDVIKSWIPLIKMI